MIIETKGTKTGDASQTGAQKYASQEAAKKSATPYYLALAVAALAGYLKSLFHTPVRAASEIEGETQHKGAPPKLVVLTSSDPAPDDARPEARIAGSSTAVPQAEAPASEYDSPDFLRHKGLQFAKPDPHPNLNDFKASPVVPRPLNDNAGAPRGGGGGRHETSSDKASGDEATDPGKHPAGEGIPVDGPVQGPVVEKDAPRDPTQAPNAGTSSHDRPRDEGGGDGLPTRDRTPTGSGEPDGRRNRAPVSSGPVYLADTTGCALLAIAMNDLLRNVQDPDGDALSVRNVTVSSGTLAHDGDGWLFDGDTLGPVTITYEVTDGEFSVAQTAVFNVVDHNEVAGSDGDDLILGTLCADAIDGGGADMIDARAGSDIVDGGPGDDHIVGGDGNDTILGGPGDDVIFAGSGADVVSGGTGNDRIFGEDGDDILSGDAGDDLVDGGEGNDILLGSTGSDMLFGEAGDDRIDAGDGFDLAFGGLGRDVVSGGAGDDRLEGGGGDDLLSDGSGRDLVSGQEGDDVLVASLDRDNDVFDGGTGQDTLDLTGTTSGVAVDLAEGIAAGRDIGTNTVASVEVVLGGSGDDTLVGSAAADTLSGGGGVDRLSGGAGNDRLEGGDAADTLSDGTGSDIVLGGAGDDVFEVAFDGEADRLDGGTGEDTLDLASTTAGVVVDLAAGTSVGAETGRDAVASIEAVLGGSGADALTGSAAGDRLFGGAGCDSLAGGAGDDVLDGGDDADALSDGTGSDLVRGGAGDDVITVAADGTPDRFEGGDGRDTLDLSTTHGGVTADLELQTLTGAETGRDLISGLEVLVGGSGADTLLGGTGGDSLSGGAGDDRLDGRSGDDHLEGGSGRDTLRDGAGCDTLRAGAGDDRIVLAMDGDSDHVDGGEGSDTLDLGRATGDLLVDLVDHVVSGTELGQDQVESVERFVAGSGNDRFVIGDDDVVLTGGGGNDGYVFLPRTGTQEPTRSVEITDFSVGDYVDFLKWSLFEEGSGVVGHSLSEAMEHNEGIVSGIRYRAALLDGGDVTVISADLDRDDRFETTVVLDGHHTLLFVENPALPAVSTPATPIT